MDTPLLESKIVIPEPLESDHWYVVDVSLHPDNPVHRAVMYAGFGIKDGRPGAYHAIYNPTYGRTYEVDDVHYLKVIQPLGNLLGEG